MLVKFQQHLFCVLVFYLFFSDNCTSNNYLLTTLDKTRLLNALNVNVDIYGSCRRTTMFSTLYVSENKDAEDYSI